MDTDSGVNLGGVLLCLPVGCGFSWMTDLSKPSGSSSIIIAPLSEQDVFCGASVWLCCELQCADCLLTEIGCASRFPTVHSPSYSVASEEIPQGRGIVANAALLQFHLISVKCWCHEVLCGLAEKRFRVDPQVMYSVMVLRCLLVWTYTPDTHRYWCHMLKRSHPFTEDCTLTVFFVLFPWVKVLFHTPTHLK